MKIVTMCRGGNVRSVAAKMILHRYLGHEVIAIGENNSSIETQMFLCKWADKIVVMSRSILDEFRLETIFSKKIILLDVDNDIWGDPFNEDLQLKIVNILNTDPFFWDSAICNYKFESIDPNKVIKTIREYKAKIAARNQKDEII